MRSKEIFRPVSKDEVADRFKRKVYKSFLCDVRGRMTDNQRELVDSIKSILNIKLYTDEFTLMQAREFIQSNISKYRMAISLRRQRYDEDYFGPEDMW